MENLSVFFSGLDAQTATFIANGQPRLVQCFFDNAFFDRSVGETVLDTTQPRITCQMAALSGVERESLVEVAGKTFSIIQIQPEGTGLATVTLAHE